MFVDAAERMVGLCLVDEHIGVGADGTIPQDFRHLFQVVVVMPGEEDDWNTSESVDQGEEEAMDKEVVVT